MNIIKLEPSATGSRPPIQSWNGYGIPDGYIEVPDGVDTSAMQTHCGFVTLLQDENEKLTQIIGHDENYQAYLETIKPDIEVELQNIKDEKISKSKDDLAVFLEENPLIWTDGNKYSVTSEKQQQLTSKIAVAQMAQQIQQPYNLTWNTTGDVCQEWTLENLTLLAFAIDAYVTPLVSYQQEKEVEIKNCKTIEEVNAIEIDYSSVRDNE